MTTLEGQLRAIHLIVTVMFGGTTQVIRGVTVGLSLLFVGLRTIASFTVEAANGADI